MGIIKNSSQLVDVGTQPIPAASRQVTVGPAVAPLQTNDAGHSLKINRNGTKIESIEVICGCGERIVVRCDYE